MRVHSYAFFRQQTAQVFMAWKQSCSSRVETTLPRSLGGRE